MFLVKETNNIVSVHNLHLITGLRCNYKARRKFKVLHETLRRYMWKFVAATAAQRPRAGRALIYCADSTGTLHTTASLVTLT